MKTHNFAYIWEILNSGTTLHLHHNNNNVQQVRATEVSKKFHIADGAREMYIVYINIVYINSAFVKVYITPDMKLV